jgi:hypothetical protein
MPVRSETATVDVPGIRGVKVARLVESVEVATHGGLPKGAARRSRSGERQQAGTKAGQAAVRPVAREVDREMALLLAFGAWT